jgi:HPt (histidine-containing phosphotransfer) domain-containing protein
MMTWLSLIAAILVITVAIIIFIMQSNRKKQKNFERLKEELRESEQEKGTVDKISQAAVSTAEIEAEAPPAPLEEKETAATAEVAPSPDIAELQAEIEEKAPEAVEVKPKREIKQYDKFNNARAIEQLGLSQDEADMFIKELIQQIDDELPKLEAAIENEDFDQIDDISHMIKGSSSSLGSGGVADVLSEMNEYSKKGRDIEIIRDYFYNLKHYFNELKTQFA